MASDCIRQVDGQNLGAKTGKVRVANTKRSSFRLARALLCCVYKQNASVAYINILVLTSESSSSLQIMGVSNCVKSREDKVHAHITCLRL